MNFLQQTLTNCALFQPLSASEILELSAQARFHSQDYAAGQVVAVEEDECNALGIVASGYIYIQRIFADGRLITIETFAAGDSFGEALMFAGDGRYPATLVAKEATRVIYIAREDIVRLCSRYPHFLSSFLRTLSDRILLLNRKIKTLSFQSIRQKVAHYLLEERQRQKTDSLSLPLNRSELADSLGVPRPSLSREFIAMRDAGWIEFDRNSVHILQMNMLESTLFQ